MPETISIEKQQILDRALSNPTDENSIKVITKAKERGWIKSQEPEAPSTAQKAAGFGLGLAESFNPLSIPHSVETIGRALFETKPSTGELSPGAVPIAIPGSTPAQDMAVADGKTLTPDLSVKNMVSKIPGTEEFLQGVPASYETAGGLTGLVLGGAKGAKGLMKGSVAKQALKAEGNVIKDVKFLMNEPEGPIMDAILHRPEKVAELYKQQKFGVDDLAGVVSSALEKKGAELGQAVGQFRDAAKADLTKSISTAPLIDGLKKLEKDVQLSSGANLLSRGDQSKLKQLLTFVSEEKLSPSDALKITDWIDNNTNYNAVASGNISQAAASSIKGFRSELKNLVRDSSPSMKDWAKADDSYSTFLSESEGLQDKFSGDQRITAVQSLLNPSKDPIKQRLTQALNIGSDAGPIEKGPAGDFFSALAERRAAQGLKALDVTKVDPIRDQTNRILQKWVSIGEKGGQAVGSGLGGLIGYQGGPAAAGAGSIMGISPGGFVGRIAGNKIGRVMGSPERLLEKAIQAKTLSKEARDLASDLTFLEKNFGVEGANTLLNVIQGSVPAVNELSVYVNRQ